MKFAISPLHVESFREYATRLKLTTDELIAKTFEEHVNRIAAMIGITDRVKFAPGDKTMQDLSDLTTESVASEVQLALDVLESVEKERMYINTSKLSQSTAVRHLLRSIRRSSREVELNVIPNFGRSTTANQTSFGATKYSFYYDIQLIEAIRQVSLYGSYFTFDMRSEPVRSRSSAEARAIINCHTMSRLGAAAFFLGLVDTYAPELDPLPDELSFAGKNASAAFKFLFYHEFAHHLLRCDRRFDDLDLHSTEIACDEFASIVFARAIGSGHIDVSEACVGLVALFFVQHMRERYTLQDIQIAESYPQAIVRLACIPALWEDYEPSVLTFPFDTMWKALEAAFHDYASLCRGLHCIGPKDHILFAGKYFWASLAEGRLSVWPHDLTPDECLKKLRDIRS